MPPQKTGTSLTIKLTPEMGRRFAARTIAKGEIIEVCPVIPIALRQCRALDATILRDNAFSWSDEKFPAAVALGFGSLYNHSATPNAKPRINQRKRTIAFTAIREIRCGEQIFFDYRWDADTPRSLSSGR